MKEIRLTSGDVAIVDDADFDRVNAWTWSRLGGSKAYATRARKLSDDPSLPQQILLHRWLLAFPAPPLEVDHIDGDGLNNTRANLRVVTHRENCQNRCKVLARSTTGITGVNFDRRIRKYAVRIARTFPGVGLRVFTLGYFVSIDEARACRLRGERATDAELEGLAIHKKRGSASR